MYCTKNSIFTVYNYVHVYVVQTYDKPQIIGGSIKPIDGTIVAVMAAVCDEGQ